MTVITRPVRFKIIGFVRSFEKYKWRDSCRSQARQISPKQNFDTPQCLGWKEREESISSNKHLMKRKQTLSSMKIMILNYWASQHSIIFDVDSPTCMYFSCDLFVRAYSFLGNVILFVMGIVHVVRVRLLAVNMASDLREWDQAQYLIDQRQTYSYCIGCTIQGRAASRWCVVFCNFPSPATKLL